jgi:hypothetical protein
MTQDELDEDAILSPTALECLQVVRAARPRDLDQARELARAELAARGMTAPPDRVVDELARYAVARHPLAFLLRRQARAYREVGKIFKSASVPSWTYPPRAAIRFDSDVDGELFVYPQVDLNAALPIFQRLFAELPDREDRFEATGAIHNRAFQAWLSLDQSAEHQIVVHIAKTTVGHLTEEDVQLMRRSPDHLIPDEGEAMALHATLIGTDPDTARLALWIPFPTDLDQD